MNGLVGDPLLVGGRGLPPPPSNLTVATYGGDEILLYT